VISEAQRTARMQGIGSSDAAAILNVCHYKTRSMTYWSKKKPSEDKPGKAAQAGNYLEEAVLNWAQDYLEQDFARDYFRLHENNIQLANFDGISSPELPEPFIVEAKTTGIQTPCEEFPTFVEIAGRQVQTAYGKAGSFKDDQLPLRVVVQVHHQFFVAGPEYKLAYVPVLRGGRGFGMYKLRRDDALVDHIIAEENRFWAEHVIPGIPPAEEVRPNRFKTRAA
jgi:predicted phage-related endonuclease